jgi:hypothetical protein
LRSEHRLFDVFFRSENISKKKVTSNYSSL